MKNIHIVPTDKPSRLGFDSVKNLHFVNDFINDYQNIYITSDEEIKEGDWVKLFVKHIDKEWVHKITKEDLLLYTDFNNEGSKIILTTDQDLIKDGVQAIDDESLEWFVKNPSCENIDFEIINDNIKWYKIIIPKEEPKKLYDLPLAVNNVTMSCTSKPKQETLEEASEKYENSFYEPNGTESVDFISGAKWQKEQDNKMYSEGDVRKAIRLARLCTLDNVTGEFIDLSGLTEVCTYGLQETHSEDSIIEQPKKK